MRKLSARELETINRLRDKAYVSPNRIRAELAEDMGRCIAELAGQLAAYAKLYAEMYDSSIGDDGVLGDDWEQAARAVIGLLNGETGNMDCGTIDGFLRSCASQHGVNLD